MLQPFLNLYMYFSIPLADYTIPSPPSSTPPRPIWKNTRSRDRPWRLKLHLSGKIGSSRRPVPYLQTKKTMRTTTQRRQQMTTSTHHPLLPDDLAAAAPASSRTSGTKAYTDTVIRLAGMLRPALTPAMCPDPLLLLLNLRLPQRPLRHRPQRPLSQVPPPCVLSPQLIGNLMLLHPL